MWKYLQNYSVLKDGFVKITPENVRDGYYDTKRCMFSIENLAWKGEKDFFKGHEDQRGTLGGRIMWFPPYGLTFNESVNVEFAVSCFICFPASSIKNNLPCIFLKLPFRWKVISLTFGTAILLK